MEHAKNKWGPTIGAVLWTLATFVAVTLCCIQGTVQDTKFFTREYEKLDIARSIGMSDDDLQRVTDRLLAYLRGEADTLDIEATVGNNLRPVFNEREKAHMVDVRALYQKAALIRVVSLTVAGAGGLLLIALLRHRRREGRAALLTLVHGFWLGCLAVGILLVGLAIAAVLDFNHFWVALHKILFNNDLWLLDPTRDLLICMVPEPFFAALVKRILVEIALIWGALLVLSFWIRRISRLAKGKPEAGPKSA